eukprot:gene6846-7614_t
MNRRKSGQTGPVAYQGELNDEMVEAWLDAHPEFVESYFSRKAQINVMGSYWKNMRRARSRAATPPVNSYDIFRSSGSGASTPVRKLSGTDFDSPGILKPIVNVTDGTHSFLGLERQYSRPSRQRKSKEELQKMRILDEYSFLIELVKEMANDLEVKSLCHKILQNVSLMTNGDRCSLFIVNGSKDGCRYLVSQVFDVNADSRVEDLDNLQEIRVPWGTGIIGYTAETGEIVNIADAYKDSRFNQEIDKKTGYKTKSILCMPIKSSEGEVIGVAQVINKIGADNEVHVFTADDEKIFEKYLVFCGIGITNAHLYERSQAEIRRNHVLLELTRTIFEEQSSLDSIVHKIMMSTQSFLQCERCSVLLVDGTSKGLFSQAFDLEARECIDDDGHTVVRKQSCGTSEVKFPINIGITGYVATTGETLNIPDAYADPRFDPSVDEGSGFRTKTILCMPIKNAAGELIGVVQLLNKMDGMPFNENDENFFAAFAIFCGMAIHHTAMYEEVHKAMAKQKVALEILSYHASEAEEVAEGLKNEMVPSTHVMKLNEYYFDDMTLSDKETCLATIRMFLDLQVVQRFHIDYHTLCRWVLSVKKNYRNVTYHNWRHAFNVGQMMFAMVNLYDEVAEWLRRWTANPLGSARVGSNPILVLCDEVAEWLRRWAANPLGSARVGSNPILVVSLFLIRFSTRYEVECCKYLDDFAVLCDEVAEWLRRWTANPLGSARVGSNPILVVSSFLIMFSIGYEVECCKYLDDFAVLCDEVAEWLRRWTANPLGSARLCDEVAEWLRRWTANPLGSARLYDEVAEWLRRWTANPLGSARVGSNPILVVSLFFIMFSIGYEVECCKYLDDFAVLCDEVAEWLRRWAANPLGSARLYDEVAEWLRRWAANPLGSARLYDEVAEWLRRWTANPLGSARLYDEVAEWLRRWTANPLGSARVGSNPILVVSSFLIMFSIGKLNAANTLMILQLYDEVAEWLRRWTANPLGSARVGSNPILVVSSFLIMFSIGYEVECCKYLDDFAVLYDEVAEWLRRWTANPLGSARLYDEVAEWLRRWTANPLGSARLYDEVAEWLRRWTANPLGSARLYDEVAKWLMRWTANPLGSARLYDEVAEWLRRWTANPLGSARLCDEVAEWLRRWTANPLGSARVGSNPILVVSSFFIMFSIGYEVECCKYLDDFAVLYDEVAEWLRRWTANPLGSARLYDEVAEWLRRWTANPLGSARLYDEVAEWLRRWTANPLGSARVGSSPILVVSSFLIMFSIGYEVECCKYLDDFAVLCDEVAEWLRRWTANPLGSARVGSNPILVVSSFFIMFSIGYEVECCKYLDDFAVLYDEVAEWLRRWTANPLGSARVGSNPILVLYDEVAEWLRRWTANPLGSARLCDEVAEWLRRWTANPLGSARVGSNPILVVSSFFIMFSIGYEVECCKYLDDFAVLYDEVAEWLRRWTANPLGSARVGSNPILVVSSFLIMFSIGYEVECCKYLDDFAVLYDEVAEWLRRWTANPLGSARLYDEVAEWLRRWTANPLGSARLYDEVAEWLRRWTANPLGSARLYDEVAEWLRRWTANPLGSARLCDEVAEWLRRWTANPLGSARVGSNPILVVSSFFIMFSIGYEVECCKYLDDFAVLCDEVAEWLRRWTANPLGCARLYDEVAEWLRRWTANPLGSARLCDEVAEWLRRWTANPLGSARVGSNPILVVSSFLIMFSIGYEVECCKYLDDFAVLCDEVAEWLRRWTANPLGSARLCDEVAEWLRRWTANPLGSARLYDEVAEWLRRWTANPLGSARVGSNPILVVSSFLIMFSIGYEVECCKYLDDFAVLYDEVAEWLRRWTANPLGSARLYDEVAEWLRRWTANPLGSARLYDEVAEWLRRWTANPLGSARLCDVVAEWLRRWTANPLGSAAWLYDEVAEWLRRWTANPLGSGRVGSSPILVVSSFLIMFSIGYEVECCKYLDDFAVLYDEVAEWLRRWTANPLGSARLYDEVAEWLRRWTANPLGSARVGMKLNAANTLMILQLYDEVAEWLRRWTANPLGSARLRDEVAEWLRRWTANPLGCARVGSNPILLLYDEVAEWLRRWTANPLGSARVGSNPILVHTPEFNESFTDIEKLSLLVGCVCHDLDHRGTNNTFQLKTESPLAQLYSTSTMERHHFDHCIMILNSLGNEIFKTLSTEEYNEAINVLEHAIMSTDLALYFKNRDIFFEIIDTDTFDWENYTHRSLLRSMLMTASDVSAITKPWNVQHRVAQLVAEEFFQQGDREARELHQTPIEMMDRQKKDKLPKMQVGFIQGVCLPVYKSLSKRFPALQAMVDGVLTNRKHWERLAVEQNEKDGSNTMNNAMS